MKIGQLKHPVVISKEVVKTDKYGTPIGKELIPIAHTWAQVTNLHGDEYYTAHTLQLHKEVLFTIRYNSKLDEKCQITFNGNDYIISFVDNIKYSNKYMEIRTTLKTR